MTGLTKAQIKKRAGDLITKYYRQDNATQPLKQFINIWMEESKQ